MEMLEDKIDIINKAANAKLKEMCTAGFDIAKMYAQMWAMLSLITVRNVQQLWGIGGVHGLEQGNTSN